MGGAINVGSYTMEAYSQVPQKGPVILTNPRYEAQGQEPSEVLAHAFCKFKLGFHPPALLLVRLVQLGARLRCFREKKRTTPETASA